MKILLSLLLLGSLAMGMTEEEILAMNEKAHDEVELMEELQIFPYSREMDTTVKVKFPKELDESSVNRTKTKFIQGKYIVAESEFESEMVNIRWVSVTTYSEEMKRYKMWVSTHIEVKDQEEPIKMLADYDGIFIEGTKSITWAQVPKPGNITQTVISSHLNPDGEHYLVYEYRNGELVSILECKDAHVKQAE